MSAFDEVLRQAIADIALHGYDDRARVDQWLVKLRDAAKKSLVPEAELTRRLTQALGGQYRRHMRWSNISSRHRKIDVFTVQQMEPNLRRILDRRIQASARLISLNRDASIQRTLQRFEGWATAIPKGGRRNIAKADIDRDLKKAFASLPFEERRVIIDQGHKLIAAIDNVIATDGKALAMIWHSHWRETGYDYRPRHKQFDGRVFIQRGNWAMDDGLMKKPPGILYSDQIEQVGELPFCRCYAQYLYALGDLPEDMLTAKGKMALTTGAKRYATH